MTLGSPRTPDETQQSDLSQSTGRRRWNQQQQPPQLVPRLQPTATFSSHVAQSRSWLRGLRDRFTDEEKAGGQAEFTDRSIRNLFTVKGSCLWDTPLREQQPLLVLTTSDEASPPGSGDIRWLHIRHSGICFDEFINLAIGNTTISSGTKDGLKNWLLSLQEELESGISTGRAFPGSVRGSMLAAPDKSKSKEHVVEHTCLFFTFPYFLLSGGRFPCKEKHTHPVRALVETLYRNESPFSRELRQAVNLQPDEGNKVLYAPQLWCLMLDDNYIVTCAPSQLYDCQTSSIATVGATDSSACVRLRLRGGLTFRISLGDCAAWLDLLIRVQHIYTHILRMHVDADRCIYRRGASELHAEQWSSIVQNERSPGCVIDIDVILPGEETDWSVQVERVIHQQWLDTSNTGMMSVSTEEVDAQSLRAFMVERNDRSYDQRFLRNRKFPPPLVDKMIGHTETRRALLGIHSQSREPDSHYVGPSSNISISGSDSDSALRAYRRSQKPDSRRRAAQGQSKCAWPGCYEHGELEDRKDRQGPSSDIFWTPPSSIRISSHATIEIGPRAYLSWSIYSGEQLPTTKVPRRDEIKSGEARVKKYRQAFKDVESSPNAPRNKNAVAVDSSLMAYLDKVLRKSSLYRNQEPTTRSEIDTLIASLQMSDLTELISLAVDARELIEHFTTVSMHSPVSQKALGSLYGVVEKCSKHNQASWRDYSVNVVCTQVREALSISRFIRGGIQGHEDRIPLLNSLLRAFQSLVLGLMQFNVDLSIVEGTPDHIDGGGSGTEDDSASETAKPYQRQVGRGIDNIHILADNEEDSDESSAISDPLQVHRPSIVRDGSKPSRERSEPRVPQRPRTRYFRHRPRQDSSSSFSSNRRTSNTRSHINHFEQLTIALELAKGQVLEVFAASKPPNIEAYSTVNPGGIVASIIASLAGGDYDNPLLLNHRHAWTAPTSSFSAGGESTAELDIGRIYQDHCSKIRLAIRDHPTRSLLDDLDLADEELDSIIAITKVQKRVISDFEDQSYHRLPTQNSWVDDLHAVRRTLDDKLDLYKDLKTQINKLARQVYLQVELKQDNNNKAILVFTTVTVIFLPLSFVTSYFGMNTPDIRDMNTGQWIFWAISLPFTALVVGFCMTVAYQGHRVQEYFRGH